MMVWQAYWKVRANRGSAGVDDMDWAYLEGKVEPRFHNSSFDELLMKAVKHYCPDRWVLMYVERWLKAGIFQSDGTIIPTLQGTPQGGVSSPLLANIFLHVVFDGWMKKYHPEKPFERYADDIVVHGKTEKQALFMQKIRAMNIHKWRGKLERIAQAINPVIRGIISYYHKFQRNDMREVWRQWNARLLKWVKWEKDLGKRRAISYLRTRYKENPVLFEHWRLVHP